MTYPAKPRPGKRRGQTREHVDEKQRRAALAQRKAARRGSRSRRAAVAPNAAERAPARSAAPLGDVGRVLASAMERLEPGPSGGAAGEALLPVDPREGGAA